MTKTHVKLEQADYVTVQFIMWKTSKPTIMNSNMNTAAHRQSKVVAFSRYRIIWIIFFVNLVTSYHFIYLIKCFFFVYLFLNRISVKAHKNTISFAVKAIIVIRMLGRISFQHRQSQHQPAHNNSTRSAIMKSLYFCQWVPVHWSSWSLCWWCIWRIVDVKRNASRPAYWNQGTAAIWHR